VSIHHRLEDEELSDTSIPGRCDAGECPGCATSRGSAQRHAGKLAPKKYGDKVVNEHTGKDGAPLLPPAPPMTKAECAQYIAEILEEASKGVKPNG
jgi:hypothetical protein